MKTRRWLAAAAALLLCTVVGAQLWAGAAGRQLDLGKECQLVVNPCDPEANQEMAEDLAASGATVVVDLYRVADLSITPDGGSHTFAPLQPYNLEIPTDPSNTDWATLAQTAADVALQPSPQKPDYTTPAGEAVTVRPGLYLLAAHAQGEEGYVRLITGEDGAESLVTQVKTEKYVYSFAPELIAIPNRMAADGSLGTGEWQYELDVTLKSQRDGRKIPLEIVKTLLTYEDSAPATFVFQLDWEADGERHSDVRTITFDAPGQKVLLVEDLPVGAVVTVTEVYSGVNYTIVGDSSQTLVLDPMDDSARVEFVNDYDDHGNEGGSITNNFTYNGESWDWEAQPDRAPID